jgi:DNA-binding response OmpR family regulator
MVVNMKLLYAEDEPALSEAVTDILTYHKYIVDAVYNGNDALDYAESGQYDGIILDIMMPGLSGTEVLKRLREENIMTPVMLLTAKTEVEDRIKGLDLGADDYLPKPFAMGELLARVRAMLRRKDVFVPDVISCGNLKLDRQNFELSAEENTVALSNLEFRMMETLIMNKGIYISSDELLEKVWGLESNAESGNVWVYISNLRKKLSSIGARVSITAKRNLGYTLEAEDD